MTPDVWEVIEAAELAAKGLWPLPGGSLDQTAIGLRAISFVWAEENRIKRELDA